MIRAKMVCESARIEEEWPDSEQVELRAVYEGHGNRSWAAATPAGTVSMQIDNKAAHGKFEVGKEYYVDFTPAED